MFAKELEGFIAYLKHEKNASPHTIASYQRDLLQLSEYLEAKKLKLKDINNIALRGFLAVLYDKGEKKSTIGRKLAAIRSFFQFCVRKHWMDDNPAKSGCHAQTGKACSFLSLGGRDAGVLRFASNG